mmetsp:Transcript_8466/g.16013  ORF Transcript_8466/g.16013 Transcript_8466/m.16013 type:complete len:149 (-) Transcript_8466:50-496(-)
MGDADTALDLLKDFRKRQEQRAKTYAEMGVFFKTYLEDHDIKRYQSLCKAVTTKFQQIGKDILVIEEKLRTAGKVGWASMIRKIQEAEKEKLQLTVKTQVLQTKYIIDRSSKEDPAYQEQLKKGRVRMSEIIEEINDILEEFKYIIHE